MNRITAIMTAIALSLLLSACGGGDGQTPQTEPFDTAPPASSGQDAPSGTMQDDMSTPGGTTDQDFSSPDTGSPDFGSEQGTGGQ